MSSIDPSREIVPWNPPEKMDLVTYITTCCFYGEFYNPFQPYTVDYRDVFGIRAPGDELKMKLLKLGWKKIN